MNLTVAPGSPCSPRCPGAPGAPCRIIKLLIEAFFKLFTKFTDTMSSY